MEIKNKSGIYKLRLPVKYFNENLSERDKETLDYYKEIVHKIKSGEQVAVILPAVRDENGNLLFDLEYVGPQE